MSSAEFIDSIYEAALVPDLWPNVLDGLGAMSGSIGGSLLAIDRASPVPRWATSRVLDAAIHDYVEQNPALHAARFQRGVAAKHPGFRREIDFLTSDEVESDPLRQFLRSKGLGWQCASASIAPGGITVLITVERRDEDGPHTDEAVQALDEMRPHLLRASMISAKLGLERSRSAVATLQAVGLPAAILTADGRALAVNRLLDGLSGIVAPAAFGRLQILHAPAQALFATALATARAHADHATWSLPVPAQGENPAAIVHVVPLRGAALDVFAGGEVLIVVVPVETPQAPGEGVLSGLFDLTPAESRLARALSEGDTIAGLSAALGVSVPTLRTQLSAIFDKTGTRRQAELLTLLSGLSRI